MVFSNFQVLAVGLSFTLLPFSRCLINTQTKEEDSLSFKENGRPQKDQLKFSLRKKNLTLHPVDVWEKEAASLLKTKTKHLLSFVV